MTANNTKHFTTSEPAINFTCIGLGQAGGRMVDEFAKIKNGGKSVYNCLALNSNKGDLKELKHILPANQICLSSLGGFGKNPQKAIEILDKNDDIRQELRDFISNRVRPADDCVLIFAGFGGGTGTSTLIKAIEDFFEEHNKPVLLEALKEIETEVGTQVLRSNLKEYMLEATKRAEDKLLKVGIVIAQPLESDGLDVLRQVHTFNQKVWKLVQDPMKGIPFVTYLDNEQFYNEFEALTEEERDFLQVNNFRDYGNKKFCQIFHELNTAPTVGGTSVVLDKQDFRRLILEHRGCLVINKISKPLDEVLNEKVIEKMFVETVEHSAFHEDISLISVEKVNGEEKQIAKKVYHLGILAVLAKDKEKEFSSNFIDRARKEISSKLPITGTFFSGFISGYTSFQTHTYAVYKTNALPRRVEKGIVEELGNQVQRFKNMEFQKTEFEQIGDFAFLAEDDPIDFEGFGLEKEDRLAEIAKRGAEKQGTDDPETETARKMLDEADFEDLLSIDITKL
ncbi:hypothetical protein [Bacillus cereus]|uniref:FtsZ/tubulin-related protein n=1 Tax=Bacillus cereus TaxID=1396 RepID=A0A164NCW4_BACCE|nr:hypothetical protein [Bacillus cereus]KZD63360.1 FtsZ/tubulin-related protein [Bacillus cereus]